MDVLKSADKSGFRRFSLPFLIWDDQCWHGVRADPFNAALCIFAVPWDANCPHLGSSGYHNLTNTFSAIFCMYLLTSVTCIDKQVETAACASN